MLTSRRVYFFLKNELIIILIKILNFLINMRFYFSSLLSNLTNFLSFLINFVNYQFKTRFFKQVYKFVRINSLFLTLTTFLTCFKKKWIFLKYVFLTIYFIDEISKIINLSLYKEWKNSILIRFYYNVLKEFLSILSIFAGSKKSRGFEKSEKDIIEFFNKRYKVVYCCCEKSIFC